jgi:hypothetical protein
MKKVCAFTVALLILSVILSVSQAQIQNSANTNGEIKRVQTHFNGYGNNVAFKYWPDNNESLILVNGTQIFDPFHEYAPGKYVTEELEQQPIQGNVLIATVGMKGWPNNGPPFYVLTLTNISQAGVCWSRVVNCSGFNLGCEIWLGKVGSNASREVTVNFPNYPTVTINGATVNLVEYSGLSIVNATDQTATSSGFGANFDSGQTGCTTKEKELWVGAITIGGSVKQSIPKNGFELLAGTTNYTLGYMSTAYLEKIVNTTGTANTGTEEREANGNSLYSDWAGCIATFAQTEIQPSPSPNPSATITPNGTTTPLPSSTPNSTSSNQTIDQSSFNLQSNSTVTAFSFDTNVPQISFYVKGPEGTTGYVKITIAKILMPDADQIQVYLDGSQINRDVTVNGEFWTVTFMYHHSSHQVTIKADQNINDSILPSWVWNAATIAIAVGITAAVCIIVWLAKKQSNL